MNDLWIKDIMTQKFLNSDLTRLIMLKYFVKDGVLSKRYNKKDTLEYIYRMYSDYENLREINPNIRIRNIHRYGISDIKDYFEMNLEKWKEYSQNNSLIWDERYNYIVNNYDEKEMAEITSRLIDMLSQKYFSLKIGSLKEMNVKQCKDDTKIDEFGISAFRNRVFEDMQYCPLCEEYNIENLVAVHILPSQYITEEQELLDKNNGLLLCRNHAKEYIDGKYWFKENGFVNNISSKNVSDKMHLSLQIRTKKRRSYIKRYEQICRSSNK